MFCQLDFQFPSIVPKASFNAIRSLVCPKLISRTQREMYIDWCSFDLIKNTTEARFKSCHILSFRLLAARYKSVIGCCGCPSENAKMLDQLPPTKEQHSRLGWAIAEFQDFLGCRACAGEMGEHSALGNLVWCGVFHDVEFHASLLKTNLNGWNIRGGLKNWTQEKHCRHPLNLLLTQSGSYFAVSQNSKNEECVVTNETAFPWKGLGRFTWEAEKTNPTASSPTSWNCWKLCGDWWSGKNDGQRRALQPF